MQEKVHESIKMCCYDTAGVTHSYEFGPVYATSVELFDTPLAISNHL